MTKAQHTPGPWKSRGCANENGDIWVDSDNWTGRKLRGHPTSIGGTIATVSAKGTGKGFSVEANARLIAAAPELLSLLERYLELHAADCVETDESSTLLAETKAIIAKATGQPA